MISGLAAVGVFVLLASHVAIGYVLGRRTRQAAPVAPMAPIVDPISPQLLDWMDVVSSVPGRNIRLCAGERRAVLRDWAEFNQLAIRAGLDAKLKKT